MRPDRNRLLRRQFRWTFSFNDGDQSSFVVFVVLVIVCVSDDMSRDAIASISDLQSDETRQTKH